MTKQTWTATVSAVLFVVLAAVIALVPVPYVTWSPGGTHDLLGQVTGTDGNSVAAITVSGPEVTTHPTTGQLRMTTVAVTSPRQHPEPAGGPVLLLAAIAGGAAPHGGLPAR